MYGHNDCFALTTKSLKKLNYRDSCRSIESSGWFIKKQDRWRHYQLHSNVGAFALPARNPTDKVVPNFGLRYMKQAQVTDGRFYSVIALPFAQLTGQSQGS